MTGGSSLDKAHRHGSENQKHCDREHVVVIHEKMSSHFFGSTSSSYSLSSCFSAR
jgi:hypothetical protein